MKRKGFTLVELLIVIAILGALAATMSVSAGNATAAAKAQAIVNNIEACKTAAAIYYSDHWDTPGIANVTAEAFLSSTSPNSGDKYIPNFADFSTGNVTFTAGSGAGRDNWNMTVSFADDVEKTNVQAALVKFKGYSVVDSNKTGFTVNLTTGKITVQ